MTKRKTWIRLFREFMQLKQHASPVEGKAWLEKEALIYKKRVKVISLAGARFLIKANLSDIAIRYFGPREQEKIKRLIGMCKPIWKG